LTSRCLRLVPARRCLSWLYTWNLSPPTLLPRQAAWSDPVGARAARQAAAHLGELSRSGGSLSPQSLFVYTVTGQAIKSRSPPACGRHTGARGVREFETRAAAAGRAGGQGAQGHGAHGRPRRVAADCRARRRQRGVWAASAAGSGGRGAQGRRRQPRSARAALGRAGSSKACWRKLRESTQAVVVGRAGCRGACVRCRQGSARAAKQVARATVGNVG
jgi:hypothetical protein